MKKVFVLAFSLLIFSVAFSQKISVNEGTETVESIKRTGLYTLINVDYKDADKAWKKRLKDFGKVSSSRGVYTITGAEIPGVTSKPAMVYSVVLKEKGGAKVWWAIDLGSSFVTSSDNSNAYKGASQVLTNFAAFCYKEDINEQIEEAEKALSKTVDDYEDVVDDGEDLLKDVEKNKEEKEYLEQKLADNANELKQLKKDIEQNKDEQKKKKKEVEKMQEAVQVVKDKLNQIGK